MPEQLSLSQALERIPAHVASAFSHIQGNSIPGGASAAGVAAVDRALPGCVGCCTLLLGWRGASSSLGLAGLGQCCLARRRRLRPLVAAAHASLQLRHSLLLPLPLVLAGLLDLAPGWPVRRPMLPLVAGRLVWSMHAAAKSQSARRHLAVRALLLRLRTAAWLFGSELDLARRCLTLAACLVAGVVGLWPQACPRLAAVSQPSRCRAVLVLSAAARCCLSVGLVDWPCSPWFG